jgi:antitoxin component YwqK of YwqJK toxin-antitoxin module
LNGKFSLIDSTGITYKGTFQNGALNGNVTGYYPNGKAKVRGNYSWNALSGEVNKYYPSGNLFEVENYSAGNLNGLKKVYGEGANGSVLRHVQNWQNGKLHGDFEKYGPDGNLIRKVRFENGTFAGEV